MPGLLYPAYQKFYSSLNSLERFDKEGDFFENISCLDSFFSEYRNITFALQSELKHTDFFNIYEKNRDKYLQDHWFVEKRNETIKQKPFQLIKEITINFYLPHHGFSILKKEFSVENDIPLESLYDELKEVFLDIQNPEVFFSASFSFHELNSDIDLFEKLVSGIKSMHEFMDAMDKEIGENCPLCNQLKKRISKIKTSNVPLDFLLVNDYVYYPQEERFERAERVAMILSLNDKKVANRIPLSAIIDNKYFNYDGTPFGSFTLMHASIRAISPGEDIMPAIMIVYDDGTYDLDAFHANIKTTIYRKINEAAKTVETQNVTEVCYMCLYSVLPARKDLPSVSKERLALSTSDILVCASIDYQLNEKEYVFDGKQMENPEYVACVMKNGCSNTLNASQTNMYPIWRAFKEKHDK